MIGKSGIANNAPGANLSASKRGRRLPFCLLLIATLAGAAVLHRGIGKIPAASSRSNARWAHLYAELPLSFEANYGQTDASVSFLAHGKGYALFLTGPEAVLTLNRRSSPAPGHKAPDASAEVRLQLLGANAHVEPRGSDELPGKVNYFLGNDPGKWRTDVPTYARVRYESIYPGVDLVYYGTQGGQLEYDFVVAPGADPHAIALGIDRQGQGRLQVNSEGDLLVPLNGSEVRLNKPVVYQEQESGVRSQEPASKGKSINFLAADRKSKIENREFLQGRYSLDTENHVHFELGPYDHTRPLVIDPVLIYATYVGGNGGDIGYAIAVDQYYDAYIAGVSNSSNFPTKSGAQDSYGGNGDCFITKMNSAGTALIYSTFLGGSATDTCTALALFDDSVFVTGYTSSTNFPIKATAATQGATPEPFQQLYGGGASDAFVTELNTNGNALVYSSYLGGTGADYGEGIAVDSNGYAYVTGSTQSADFPILAASGSSTYQATLVGTQDAFITKVNLDGEALVYSTYLGGSLANVAQAIQVDSSGDTYVAGYTFSADFPTVNPYQPANAAGPANPNAFVAEMNPTASALTFSTYLGGSTGDRAYGLALDSSANVYVVGATSSANYPTTSGAVQTTLAGASNAFLAKFNPAGSSLLYSTYLGGSVVDQANAVAIISGGVAALTGYTESTNFPTANPTQTILGLSSQTTYCGSNPCADAFLSEIDTVKNALTFSTYFGGNGPDFGQAVTVDNTGDPYITGSTSSTNLPVATLPLPGTTYVPPYSSTLIGTAGNAFIAKYDPENEQNISITPTKVNFGNETISVPSTIQQIQVVNPSTVPLTISGIIITPIGTSSAVYTETDNCTSSSGSVTLNPGGDYCTIDVTFTPNETSSETTTLTIYDNAGGTPNTQQIVTLSGTGVTAATAVTVSPTSLSFTSQAVGTVSAPQSVTVTNTGTQTLAISSITTGTSQAAADFVENSNSCTALQDILAVGQSCTITVTFSPTASGTRSAALTISDNATGSPQTVALTGTGAAAFTLTSPSATNPATVGVASTTFTITAELAPGISSFGGTISLACSAGTTCNFNPVTISASGGAGASTTMTVSNLSTNPSTDIYLFTVTGTSGSQTYTLQLSLGFKDYTLTATPSAATVTAGHAAIYTIFVNPVNSFNEAVQLEVKGQPNGSTVTFATPNAQLTPNGTSPISTTMSIQTTTYVLPNAQAFPRAPTGRIPPIIFGILSLAGLAALTLGRKRRARQGWWRSGWLGVRLATISLILALNLALVSCRSSTLLQFGSIPGSYTMTVSGVLVSNTDVVRQVVVSLAVTGTSTI